MATLADVLNVKPPGSVASARPDSASAPAGAQPLSDEPDAGGGDVESQLSTYAWEFHQAKNPQDARDALEAFVRLVQE